MTCVLFTYNSHPMKKLCGFKVKLKYYLFTSNDHPYEISRFKTNLDFLGILPEFCPSNLRFYDFKIQIHHCLWTEPKLVLSDYWWVMSWGHPNRLWTLIIWIGLDCVDLLVSWNRIWYGMQLVCKSN